MARVAKTATNARLVPRMTREVIYLLDLCGKLELIDLKLAEELRLFAGRVAAALAALRKTMPPRRNEGLNA